MEGEESARDAREMGDKRQADAPGAHGLRDFVFFRSSNAAGGASGCWPDGRKLRQPCWRRLGNEASKSAAKIELPLSIGPANSPPISVVNGIRFAVTSTILEPPPAGGVAARPSTARRPDWKKSQRTTSLNPPDPTKARTADNRILTLLAQGAALSRSSGGLGR